MTFPKHTPTYAELSVYAAQPNSPLKKSKVTLNSETKEVPVSIIPSGVPKGEDDYSQLIVHSADVYYIREELHRLNKDKADKSAVDVKAKALEHQVETLNNRIDKSTHCTKANEFAELKEAVNTWRTFFRNTIVSGSIGALFIIGGWLWQYYSLTSNVDSTAQEISTINKNIKTLQDDYQSYKQTTFETETKTTHEFDAKLMTLEYKLLTAMSQLSKGQTVAAPTPPPQQ